MKLRRLIAACAALALAGGWYFGLASPVRRFETALRSLRANDPEKVSYELLAIEPSNRMEAQASLLRGWLMMKSGDRGSQERTGALIEELNDAASDDEQNRALALALLARVRYENHQLADVVQLLGEALTLDPNEVEAHRWAGIILYELGLYMRAIPHLELVARLEPSNGRLHRLLGVIHRERGAIVGDAFAYKAAIEAYEESLRRDPDPQDMEDIRVELARCYLSRNEWDEALAALRPCSDTTDCLAIRAECYYSKGELERALGCIDRALAEAPDDAQSLSVKATLVTAKRDLPQAAELLERALVHEPANYNYRYRLVQVYRNLGKDDLADEHAAIMDRLLKLLEEQGNLSKRALTEGDPAIRFRLHDLCEQLGDHKMAESWRKAAEMLVSPAMARLNQPLPNSP